VRRATKRLGPFLVLVVAIAAALADWAIGAKDDWETYISGGWCPHCGSEWTERRLRTTGGEEREWTEYRYSPLYLRQLQHIHEHDWIFCSYTRRRLDYWEHGDGFPERWPNPFVDQYNGNEKFRAYVDERIASGDIPDSMLLRIIGIDKVLEFEGDARGAVEARAVLREFGIDDP